MQRRLGQGLPLGVHHRFQVVQQHHHRLPGREGLQHAPASSPRGVWCGSWYRRCSRCASSAGSSRSRSATRVGYSTWCTPLRLRYTIPPTVIAAEVAFHVRDPARLQALEQPAHHRGLADPAPPDHGHHPDPRVGHIPGQQAGLHLPVLEPGRRRRRRRVDELRRPHRLRLGRDLLPHDPAADRGAASRPGPAASVPPAARARPGSRTTAWSARCPAPGGGTRPGGPRTRDRSIPTAGYPHRQRRCPAGTPAGPGPPRWRCRTPAPYTTPPACPAPGSRTGCPAPPHTRRSPRTRSTHSCAAGLIGGRKVGHIHDHVPGSRDRPLHRRHVRPPRREVPQLGGVRDEHPPPGITIRTTRASQPHPTPSHSAPTQSARSSPANPGPCRPAAMAGDPA